MLSDCREQQSDEEVRAQGDVMREVKKDGLRQKRRRR